MNKWLWCVLGLGLFAVACSDTHSDTQRAAQGDTASSTTGGNEDSGTGLEDTRTNMDVSGEDAAQDSAVDTMGLDTAMMPDLPSGPVELAECLEAGQVRAGVVDSPEALLRGVKADGRLGDIKMYNTKATFIIEGARRSSGGYRFWGGNVVDMNIVRDGCAPGPDDLFGEIGHSWNLRIFRPESVEVLSNGTGGPAHVRFRGRDAAFAWADSFIQSLLNPAPVELEVVYDYTLEADSSSLKQTVTVTNTASTQARVDFPLKLANHGDGLRQWQEGAGYEFRGARLNSIDLVSRDLSYTLVPDFGQVDMLFEYSNVALIGEDPFMLEPGETLSRSYRIAVSDRGSSGLRELSAELLEVPERVSATLEGNVTLSDMDNTIDAYVSVLNAEGDPFTFAPVDANGAFRVRLPAGSYDVTAYTRGHAASAIETVVLAEGESKTLNLVQPEPGSVTVMVNNSGGFPEDGRVMLIAQNGTPSPYPPDNVRNDSTGAWRWVGPNSGGQISAVGYAVGGETTLRVPAGDYRVTASRGFAYTVDEETITVVAGEVASTVLVIDKVVDTSGWLSSDFHIHAIRSPDSDVPLDRRLMQAITEELDLPIITEHVSISPAEELAAEMDIGQDKTIAVNAQEVTTFAYGHFNAFPLMYKPMEYNSGAVFPYDKQPAELFAAIRDQNPDDEIIQVNHPRGGNPGSYFSYVGYDPETGDVRFPDAWDLNWDAIEVFNGRCNRNAEVVQDWISMTNLGLRKTLASGSDSHRENDTIGMPRNWIKIDRSTFENGARGSIVDPVRGRQMFVSCGPFVRFESGDRTAGMGEMIGVNDAGQVDFWVEVQAPGWIQLDEVRLWRNGVIVQTVPIEIGTDGVRLETTLSDQPEQDAWYSVEVIGSGSMLPVHGSGPPYALTNPIEVDVDGDGEWTPPGLP